MDKGGDPYLPEVTFDSFINDEASVMFNGLYDDFQETGELSDKISTLTIPFSLKAVTEINTVTTWSDYWHIINLLGNSIYQCGTVTKNEWIPITPIKPKEESTIYADAYNKPSEHNFYYTISADKIRLIAPKAIDVRGNYLKLPNKIDSQNNPNTVCEFSDDVCMELTRMAMQKYMISIGMLQESNIVLQNNELSKQNYERK
jgi:hypothetical protein